MFNMLSLQKWVPVEGITIRLYPNTNNPQKWVLLVNKENGESKYLEVPTNVVPRGVPDSGIELSAVGEDTAEGRYYVLRFSHIHATTARQIRVPGKTAIKKAVEDVSRLDLSSLAPHIMRLLN